MKMMFGPAPRPTRGYLARFGMEGKDLGGRDMAAWNPTAALPSERTGRVHRMDPDECPYPPSPGALLVV